MTLAALGMRRSFHLKAMSARDRNHWVDALRKVYRPDSPRRVCVCVRERERKRERETLLPSGHLDVRARHRVSDSPLPPLILRPLLQVLLALETPLAPLAPLAPVAASPALVTAPWMRGPGTAAGAGGGSAGGVGGSASQLKRKLAEALPGAGVVRGSGGGGGWDVEGGRMGGGAGPSSASTEGAGGWGTEAGETSGGRVYGEGGGPGGSGYVEGGVNVVWDCGGDVSVHSRGDVSVHGRGDMSVHDSAASDSSWTSGRSTVARSSGDAPRTDAGPGGPGGVRGGGEEGKRVKTDGERRSLGDGERRSLGDGGVAERGSEALFSAGQQVKCWVKCSR